MFSKKVIRIVAIVMAILMFLGAFGAVISAFAADTTVLFSMPETGQPSSFIPLIIGIIALVAAIICAVMSKKNKKSS